jgi:hypothetical protein
LKACHQAPAPAAKIPEESKSSSKESLQEKFKRVEIENAKLISVSASHYLQRDVFLFTFL